MCANFTKSIAMPIKMAATKYCTKCNLSQVSSKKRTFFWGQAQIQHIHQCAEHRSNTGGDWKAKSTSNNVAKTGEEEEQPLKSEKDLKNGI
ncbi:hypothetical protein WN943_013887 [Citrus x changshan-huyou]